MPNLVRIGTAMASPGGGEIWRNGGLACLFLGFFLFSGSRPGQTRGPILASDTSKRVFWPKEVPFGV